MLPCWEGLQVGQSTTQNSLEVFQKEFGLGSDFLQDTPDRHSTAVPGLLVNNFSWSYPRSADFVNLSVWREIGTNILEALRFEWHFESQRALDNVITPQRIVKELGTPSHIYILLRGTESASTEVFKLFMIYDQGMSFSMSTRAPMTQQNGTFLVKLCLGNNQWVTMNNAGGVRAVSIMRPIVNSTNDLSALQKRLFGTDITSEGYETIEDVAQITPDQFAQTALRQDDPCFSVELH